MSNLIAKLNAYSEKGLINSKLKTLILEFYNSYRQALAQSPHSEKNQHLFEQLIELVVEKLENPYTFSIFHHGIRQPFDYYQFGLDFIRPFVDFNHSKVFGLKSILSIQKQLKNGENVILLANHQIEPDPQIISLLLEKYDPKLASEMVFVAGHRVISDPMAIPMSLGRNLLCIYSKKHLSHVPEEKAQKILHNQRTLKKIQEILNEGGYCIYVAPSGGRDRLNAAGEVDISPFDPQSVELFRLMGHQAERLTHFYPLALQTYHLMPPPRQVEQELGEKRFIHITPVYLAFGEEVDMENFPGSENLDKRAKRNKLAEYIWSKVYHEYQSFPKKGVCNGNLFPCT
jgi:glycerol-3-phosphate O-acyltransferase